MDGWTRDKVEQSPVSIDWAPVVELEEVDRFRARVPTQTHRRLEERVIQTWKRLIRNYTRRAVSDPMDRLPALSAIAQRLEGLSTHRYAGGLWFGDVPHLLFWYPVDVESMTRSPERAAPSWSWASVTGAIDFIDVKETNISVLGVSQTELILWGILEETIIGREGSSSTGYLVFYEGMWGWEEHNAIEGVVTMEAPSIFVSNEEWHHEMIFFWKSIVRTAQVWSCEKWPKAYIAGPEGILPRKGRGEEAFSHVSYLESGTLESVELVLG